ncbi:MAG: hypothetical protein LBF22_12435 [Deltaproteobacteria bacterium]|nr:hypothetical protein [Deltaproteobacteria bacterium]
MREGLSGPEEDFEIYSISSLLWRYFTNFFVYFIESQEQKFKTQDAKPKIQGRGGSGANR